MKWPEHRLGQQQVQLQQLGHELEQLGQQLVQLRQLGQQFVHVMQLKKQLQQQEQNSGHQRCLQAAAVGA